MAIYETIHYDVIKRDGPIEIRQYNDILLASTKTKKNQTQDSGFSNVFRYISGNNSEQQKISMTTPVVTYEDADQLVTGFYVPSQYNKDSVPKPIGEKVFINEMKGSLYAVIKFSGRWTDKNYDKHDQELLAYIEDSGYEVQSTRILFRYQAPFVPPMFRKNELAYKIKKI